MQTILYQDQSTDGQSSEPKVLTVFAETVTVREIIRSRVYQEVQDYNNKCSGIFSGLVQPSDSERLVNGFKIHSKRMLDWKSQFENAVQAFETSRFIILVGDRQAESLDEEIHLRSQQESVIFLKLVPLVGG